MEFDANLKREILEQIESDSAYLAAIFTSIGRIETNDKLDNLYISHTLYEIAWDIARAIKELYPRTELEMTFEEPHGTKKTRGYVVIVDTKTTREIIKDYDLAVREGLLFFKKNKYDKLNEEKSIIAFLQGIFLSKGRVFLPNSEEDNKKSASYQLEIVVSTKKQVEFIRELFLALDIAIKESERRDIYILYIKDSEIISDYLALMGASNAVLELQSLIIERDVRNNANRAVNCNVANITKTINASSTQIEAIRLIENRQGLGTLDDKLRELAEVRLNNPEATLTDLAELLRGGVTKSGINHRMRRLLQIAFNDIKGE